LILSFCAASLAGCFSGKDKDKHDDTGDTAAEELEHPLVPDEYRGIWDTDGCDDGKAAVYHVAQGRSEVGEDDDGDEIMYLSFTEHWYWFWGNDDYEGDCVDEFSFQGVESNANWGASDPCSECEEEFTGDYTESADGDDGCSVLYSYIFLDEGTGSNNFTAMFKLDTLTPSGNPNVDNKALVIGIFKDSDGYWYPDTDYARGPVVPDTEGDYGGVSSYDWVNTATMCVGS